MSHFQKSIYLYQLLKSQWQDYEKLKDLQNRKLRLILKYAYDNIPFYHEKFRKAKIKPGDIKTIEELVKLPYTTRLELQNAFPDRIVRRGTEINKCFTSMTSGSTGMPLTVVYGKRDEDFEKAVALRCNIACGQKLFDRWVVISTPKHIKSKHWFQKVGLFNPEYISVYDNIDIQISKIKKNNPQILDGFASSIFMISKEINKQQIKTINPKIIFSTAEVLSGKARRYINSTFDINIFDQFGCVEMGRTAWECPEHNGYHIDMEAVIMEFISNNEQVSSGESGEIVYTNLYNYTMPFIRYKIEDVGIPSDEKCNCGRGLPMMKILEGRKEVFMITPNGKIIPPIIWPVIMEKIKSISQYKIIQEKINLITIKIVPTKSLKDEEINRMIFEIKSYIGDDIEIKVDFVETIPREKSGKFKTVISKIKTDW